MSISGQKDSQMLEAALRYSKYGWSVIPVHSIRNGCCTCKKLDCDKPGKHPVIGWTEFQKRRATEQEIRRWWTQWPWANVAIVTGSISGLMVLDIDGPEGFDSIKEKELPHTPTIETGGGGRHYYFSCPGSRIGNRIGLLPHVDIKSEGGYVVAPPSIHKTGKEYQWLPGASPEEFCSGRPPAMVIKRIKKL